MKRLRISWIEWSALAVLGAFGVRTISNSGVWLHLALGRSIAENGIPRTDPLSFSLEGLPWSDPSWLYDLAIYGAWQAGGPALTTAVHVLLAALAFLLLIPLARRHAGPNAVAAALLLSSWLAAPLLQCSPRIAALPLAAGMLRIATTPLTFKRALLALGLQVLWVQIDSSFILGPMMLSLSLWRAREQNVPQKPAVLLTGAATLMFLCNPYGPSLGVHLIRTWADVGYVFVTDWISPISWHFSNLLGTRLVTMSLLLALLGFVIFPGRLPLGLTIPASLMGILAILRPHQFNDLYALYAFPFFALSFSALARALSQFKGGAAARFCRRAAAPALSTAALTTLLAVTSGRFFNAAGSASSFGFGVSASAFPEAAAAIIEHPAFPERVVNTAHDGGYLAWRYPERKIFTDARADLYTSLFYQHMADAFMSDEETRSRFILRWEVEGVIFNCCLPGAGQSVKDMLSSGAWGLAYFDGTTAILLRNTAANRVLLDNQSIQAQGLLVLERARQQYLFQLDQKWLRPSHEPRLFGAGALFLELGQYERALPVYAALARGAGNLPMAWNALGYCNIRLGRFEMAADILRFAADRFPDQYLSWLWLSHVEAELGRAEAARSAFEKASLLRPDKAAQFGNPLDSEIRKKQVW